MPRPRENAIKCAKLFDELKMRCRTLWTMKHWSIRNEQWTSSHSNRNNNNTVVYLRPTSIVVRWRALTKSEINQIEYSNNDLSASVCQVFSIAKREIVVYFTIVCVAAQECRPKVAQNYTKKRIPCRRCCALDNHSKSIGLAFKIQHDSCTNVFYLLKFVRCLAV